VRWKVDHREHVQARAAAHGSPATVPRIACGSEVRVAVMTGIVDVHFCEATDGQQALLVAGFKVRHHGCINTVLIAAKRALGHRSTIRSP
jgi:hypothetical protein